MGHTRQKLILLTKGGATMLSALMKSVWVSNFAHNETEKVIVISHDDNS